MCGKIKVLQPYLLPYSYSLFEPNSRTLAEYGVSLEKAILRDSELLSDVNNAFCNSHPLLAQKVVTRSARAAVSKISADALLAKAISVRRSQAGSLLKTIRKVNAKKLQESDILVGHRFHTAGAEPYSRSAATACSSTGPTATASRSPAIACSSAGPTACSVTPADAPPNAAPNAAPAFFTAPATRMALPRGGGEKKKRKRPRKRRRQNYLFYQKQLHLSLLILLLL